MPVSIPRLLPLTLAVMLGGCGGVGAIVSVIPGFGDDAPEARPSYIPPADGPGTRSEAMSPLPVSQAWDALLRGLRGGPFRIASIDERAGLVILTYAGEPGTYIECGQIARLQPDRDPVLRPAAASNMVEQASDGSRVERTLELDSRVTVLLSPSGTGSRLTSDALHVAVKKVRHYDTSGRRIAEVVDLVDFSSGERGQFAAGTACQSTGELERTALRGIDRELAS